MELIFSVECSVILPWRDSNRDCGNWDVKVFRRLGTSWVFDGIPTINHRGCGVQGVYHHWAEGALTPDVLPDMPGGVVVGRTELSSIVYTLLNYRKNVSCVDTKFPFIATYFMTFIRSLIQQNST